MGATQPTIQVQVTEDVKLKDGATWRKGLTYTTTEQELQARGVPANKLKRLGAKEAKPAPATPPTK